MADIAGSARVGRGILVIRAGRRLRQLLRDPYIVYTSLLAPIGYAAALVAGSSGDLVAALASTPVFVGAQVLLGLVPRTAQARFGSTGWALIRLAVPLAFVSFLANTVGGPTRPLLSLYLPVVAAASAIGLPEALIVGTLAAVIYLAPLIGIDVTGTAIIPRAVVHAGVAILLAIATRRMVGAIEATASRLRAATIGERRRSRQISALEEVGRLLVGGGEISDVLSQVLAVLSGRFGYRYVSIYLWDGEQLRLGAQVNYAHAPPMISPGIGVVGRVAMTHEPAFIPDVSLAADYIAVHEGVASEVCVPLLVERAFLGVLNVESLGRLTHTDRDLVAVLAHRVATVVALGRDRQVISEREELFRSLHAFTAALSATLKVDELANLIAEWTQRVIPSELVMVTLLDGPTGRHLIRAVRGVDPVVIGRQVKVGQGVAGQVIRDRTALIDSRLPSGDLARELGQDLGGGDRIAASMPLTRDNAVIGTLTISRADLAASLRPVEIEALQLLAGDASLAVSNAFLHADVESLAIRDPLTGLHNRRYFDEALDALLAGHRRGAGPSWRPLAVILFDLDHFGQFNRDHGHQVGDAVLIEFARVLERRFRGSDLVARFGGEEFLAVLDGATLNDAQAAAEEVRHRLEEHFVPDEDGQPLRVTVSAGCAELDEANPTREWLLRTADVALFMAKRAGRNRVVAA